MYPSPYIKFKSHRLEREWFEGAREPNDPRSLHPALYVLVLSAALWLYRRTGKPAVVTCLLRDRDEQLGIYPGSPDRRSPHEFGRAADLRTRDLDEQVSREWEVWINESFPYHGRAGLKTALLHEVGGRGGHIHIQAGPLEARPQAPDTFIAE